MSEHPTQSAAYLDGPRLHYHTITAPETQLFAIDDVMSSPLISSFHEDSSTISTLSSTSTGRTSDQDPEVPRESLDDDEDENLHNFPGHWIEYHPIQESPESDMGSITYSAPWLTIALGILHHLRIPQDYHELCNWVREDLGEVPAVKLQSAFEGMDDLGQLQHVKDALRSGNTGWVSQIGDQGDDYGGLAAMPTIFALDIGRNIALSANLVSLMGYLEVEWGCPLTLRDAVERSSRIAVQLILDGFGSAVFDVNVTSNYLSSLSRDVTLSRT